MASRMGVILADHCASVRSYTSSESPDTSVDVSESDTSGVQRGERWSGGGYDHIDGWGCGHVYMPTKHLHTT